MAIEQFEVAPVLGDWPESSLVESRLIAAIEGRLPVEELLVRRREAYRSMRGQAAQVAPPKVLFDHSAQPGTEVVEVRCTDRAGILGMLGQVLTDLGLDVVQARAATLGHEVIDAFYVQPVDGRALTGDDRDRITQALIAAAEGD